MENRPLQNPLKSQSGLNIPIITVDQQWGGFVDELGELTPQPLDVGTTGSRTSNAAGLSSKLNNR
jgi:hypothetical protein